MRYQIEAFDRFKFVIRDAMRFFGQWDIADPVVWAILRVVQAQNNLAHAINTDSSSARSMVENAIAERLAAVAALQRALAREPRGFQ